MAQLNTKTLTITVSQLLRDSDTVHELLDQDTIQQLEAVVTELANAGGTPVIVEIALQ
jgi:hypothetical protein